MEIQIIDNPKDSEISSITSGIREYGLSEVNGELPKHKAVILKENDTIIGGAVGKVHVGQFYLDYFWVSELNRNKGYGKRIHTVIEKVAKDEGCADIRLQTLNEASKSLYMKLGYEEVTSVTNYVASFTLYHLIKII